MQFYHFIPATPEFGGDWGAAPLLPWRAGVGGNLSFYPPFTLLLPSGIHDLPRNIYFKMLQEVSCDRLNFLNKETHTKLNVHFFNSCLLLSLFKKQCSEWPEYMLYYLYCSTILECHLLSASNESCLIFMLLRKKNWSSLSNKYEGTCIIFICHLAVNFHLMSLVANWCKCLSRAALTKIVSATLCLLQNSAPFALMLLRRHCFIHVFLL